MSLPCVQCRALVSALLLTHVCIDGPWWVLHFSSLHSNSYVPSLALVLVCFLAIVRPSVGDYMDCSTIVFFSRLAIICFLGIENFHHCYEKSANRVQHESRSYFCFWFQGCTQSLANWLEFYSGIVAYIGLGFITIQASATNWLVWNTFCTDFKSYFSNRRPRVVRAWTKNILFTSNFCVVLYWHVTWFIRMLIPFKMPLWYRAASDV